MGWSLNVLTFLWPSNGGVIERRELALVSALCGDSTAFDGGHFFGMGQCKSQRLAGSALVVFIMSRKKNEQTEEDHR